MSNLGIYTDFESASDADEFVVNYLGQSCVVSKATAKQLLGILALEAGIPAANIPAIAAQVAPLLAFEKSDVGLSNVDNTSDLSKPVSAAQQAAINSAIAGIVSSSPVALDTLKELADALGDDPNFSTTVLNALAGKLSKSGGTMTGALDLFGLPTVGGATLLSALGISMGSFTPSFSLATPGSSSVSVTYARGKYLRALDFVFFQMSMSFTPTIGTGSGALRFSLPFAAASEQMQGIALPVSINERVAWPNSGTQLIGAIDSGTSYMTLRTLRASNIPTTLQASDLTAGGILLDIGGFYKAASA